VGARVRTLFGQRGVLANLVRKELKVKYAASVLGAVWSLLNPVAFLAVFTFLVVVLGTLVPNYPVFLLAGLLAWNLFANSLLTGARSVIDNANLVKKMAFPREILPFSALGVAGFDFVLQSIVLLLFVAIWPGAGFDAAVLWLYPLAIVVLFVFTTALSLWVSALNVRYRDVGHLLSLTLLVWFWATPIVYQGALVQDKLQGFLVLGVDAWTLYLLNPMTVIVLAFQRALYGLPSGGELVLPAMSLGQLTAMVLAVLAVSVLLMLLAWRAFFRRSGDFAEEL
jgi:ABC-2 type transport system permease protein